MQWSEPYAPRPIRPLGTERLGDSRVKLYGIAYGRCSGRRRTATRSHAPGDLVVVGHERDAWVRHILGNPGGPDLDATWRTGSTS